jgi:hypothetical protein
MTRPLSDVEEELHTLLDWVAQTGGVADDKTAARIKWLQDVAAKRKGQPVPVAAPVVEPRTQELEPQQPVEVEQSRAKRAWGHTVATAKHAWDIHPMFAVGVGLVLLAGLAVAFVYVAPLAFLGWLFWLLSTRHRNRTAHPGKPVQEYKRSRVTYGRLKALENQDRIEQQLQRIVVNLNVPDDKDKGGVK